MNITSEQLRTRYDDILIILKQKKFYVRIGMIVFLGSVFGIATPIMFLVNDSSTQIKGILSGVILAFIFFGIYLIQKGEKVRLNKRQKTFFEFYNIYVCLEHFNSVQDNKKSQNAIEAAQRLSRFIGSWTDVRSPQEISKLPNLIKKNIDDKFIPLINTQNQNSLIPLINYLRDFVPFVYDDDPSIKQLEEFNLQLEKLPAIVVEKPTEPTKIISAKKIEERISLRSKIIIGGIIFGIVFYQILVVIDIEEKTAVLATIPSSIAVMSLLARLNRLTNKSS